MEKIENDPTLKQILADSFGGVMYDIANRGRYDTRELLTEWDKLTPTEQESYNGIIKGAINFAKGK